MDCAFCANPSFRKGTVNLTFEREGRTVMVFDIPADICEKCGESVLEAEVVGQLEQLVAEAFGEGREQATYRRAA